MVLISYSYYYNCFICLGWWSLNKKNWVVKVLLDIHVQEVNIKQDNPCIWNK